MPSKQAEPQSEKKLHATARIRKIVHKKWTGPIRQSKKLPDMLSLITENILADIVTAASDNCEQRKAKTVSVQDIRASIVSQPKLKALIGPFGIQHTTTKRISNAIILQ